MMYKDLQRDFSSETMERKGNGITIKLLKDKTIIKNSVSGKLSSKLKEKSRYF